MNYGYIGSTPITSYGCVLCQREHRLGIDPEFESHSYRQSKHGISNRAPIGPRETLVAVVLAEERKAGQRDDRKYGV
jgi:hypothetical protein